MAASKEKPVYTAYIIAGSKKFNVTPALVSVDRNEADGQIAQRVNLQLMNVQVKGSWISGMFQPRNRVYLYADDGSKKDEVFRGYLWGRKYKSSSSEWDLSYTCYDNLIYFQESEDSLYFSDGKVTKDIMQSICEKWNIPLNYSYDSITHTKLPLRGKLYDLFSADILDLVKKQTGKKYVILSDKDTMHVKHVGTNATVYRFIGTKNVVSTTSGWTMDGVITQVVIVGKADDEERLPVEATVTGNTSEYGTLQKIQSKDENTSLEDAKLEAQTTIDESGAPKWEYEITAPDIPWIRKGDKVYVDAGDIVEKYLIVTAVDRSSNNKKSEMQLTLEDVQKGADDE